MQPPSVDLVHLVTSLSKEQKQEILHKLGEEVATDDEAAKARRRAERSAAARKRFEARLAFAA